MNQPQTDTPRTDHIESALGTASQQCHPTIWMHARQLERELASVTKQRDALAEALREMQYGHTDKAERMANEALATLNHP